MGRKLYKSKRNKVLFGVCGGFAEYFNIDVTLVRLVFIVLALSGASVLGYIIAALIMPEEDGQPKSDDTSYSSAFDEDSEWETKDSSETDRNKKLIGLALILIGVLFLLRILIPWFDAKFLAPIMLIGIGLLIILRGRQ